MGFLNQLKQAKGKNSQLIRPLYISFLLIIILLGAFLLTALILFLIFNSALNEKNQKINMLEQVLNNLTQDYNLVRMSLGLQPLDFPLTTSSQSEELEKDPPLIAGLKLLQARFNDERKIAEFNAIRNSSDFKLILSELKALALDLGPFSTAIVKNGNIYFMLSFQPAQEIITIEAAGEKSSYRGKWGQEALAFLHSNFPKVINYYLGLEQIKEDLKYLEFNEKISQILKRKNLSFKLKPEDYQRLEISFFNQEAEHLSLTFDKLKNEYRVGTKIIKSFAQLKDELPVILQNLDTRSLQEKQVEAVVLSLKESFKDETFQSFLKNSNLTISPEPRLTDDFYYFDINQNGVKIGACAVNRFTAEVYFVDKDNVQVIALRTLAGSNPVKKKLN